MVADAIVIYPALERGKALVLVDGYDELAPRARENYSYWLHQLLALYGQNMIVIAGPVTGYEPLITLGFTPTFLRMWREEDCDLLVRRWGQAWSPGKRGAKSLDEQTMRRISIDNLGRTPLDVTLKLWTGLADDAREPGRMGWYDGLIHRRVSMPAALESLGRHVGDNLRLFNRGELDLFERYLLLPVCGP